MFQKYICVNIFSPHILPTKNRLMIMHIFHVFVIRIKITYIFYILHLFGQLIYLSGKENFLSLYVYRKLNKAQTQLHIIIDRN